MFKKKPMKILITSDNHLGFKETDPIRHDDSFRTFKEILEIAREEDVDLLLQGGDLFDENKPSRNTYSRTLSLLREHCLGSKKPRFTSSVPLNMGSESMAISLPILGIHGNHDDPSGLETVSSLDVLHSAGLINYFGKCSNIIDIVIEPILIEGDAKIAIYGLGYVKDRVLYDAFKKGRVRYNRPEGEGWFSIFVVHQNRVPRHEEYLPEDFVDSFFDLVVYGHEHESIRLRHKNFDVIQCGSTVRTSLCDGEAGDKFVYLLEVGEGTTIRRRKLETVRPLLIETIKIGLESNPEEVIGAKLRAMGRQAVDDGAAGDPFLPLIRLRAEVASHCRVSKHRLSQVLTASVANPSDALKIIKKTEKRPPGTPKPGRGLQIEDVYRMILGRSGLNVIPIPRVIDSLNDFILKDAKDPFSRLINDSVEKIVSRIDFESIVLEDVSKAIRHAFVSLYGPLSKPAETEEACLAKVEEPSNRSVISLPAEAGITDRDSLRASVSFDENSFECASTGTAQKEFTFLEDKRDYEISKAIIDRLQDDPVIKKGKTNEGVTKEQNESDDDFLAFRKYL